eukprot:4096533-Prymnesium_polylepis.2
MKGCCSSVRACDDTGAKRAITRWGTSVCDCVNSARACLARVGVHGAEAPQRPCRRHLSAPRAANHAASGRGLFFGVVGVRRAPAVAPPAYYGTHPTLIWYAPATIVGEVAELGAESGRVERGRRLVENCLQDAPIAREPRIGEVALPPRRTARSEVCWPDGGKPVRQIDAQLEQAASRTLRRRCCWRAGRGRLSPARTRPT